MDIPTPPPALKVISPYMKLAKDYDKREPVVAYYCRLYCIQKGIATDSKSPDCKTFLFTLMDILENAKKGLAAQGIEAVTNELVAQAHMEAVALNLFDRADQEDRKSNFNKALIKSFYSANLLFDVIKQFGEVSEEIALKQKYAKWKATYIHKCLQTGEAPIPGPQGSEFEGTEFSNEPPSMGGNTSAVDQLPSFPQPYSTNQMPYPPPSTSYQPPNLPSTSTYAPPGSSYEKPAQPEASYSTHQDDDTAESGFSSNNSLGPADFQQATKFCKFAISSLQYEDVSSAVENLTKALRILKTNK